MKRKDIILTIGSGAQLYPTKLVLSRQLLRAFEKPKGLKITCPEKWVPAGIAHGFITLSETAEYEVCIRWDDPDIAVEWPIDNDLELSGKDKQAVQFFKAGVFA